MNNIKINTNTITGQIQATALKLLERSPDGIQWSELNRQIKQLHPDFHPKTINGTVWKLPEKFPQHIQKANKGLFKVKS